MAKLLDTSVTSSEMELKDRSEFLTHPASPYGSIHGGGGGDMKGELEFATVHGAILPWKAPNVRPGFEDEDLKKAINKEFSSAWDIDNQLCNLFCTLTGIGACYVWCNMHLVSSGEWGFVMHSGRPELLLPGRYFYTSCLSSYIRTVSTGDDLVSAGPITIVRINKGSIGLAFNNSEPELLLPGRHVRVSSTFKFVKAVSFQETLIELGPIKIFTVASGGVRVCYDSGKVQIYREGRYAANSPVFTVAGLIDTTMQNIKFDSHKCLLDGGISLSVEGLLTYQVTDPALLIKELGERDLQQALSQTAKAEIARVFATVHLEQISTSYAPDKKGSEKSVLGPTPQVDESTPEGETRSYLCQEILKSMRPVGESWGVKVINFQLESTVLSDPKYAAEYEEASLQLAKSISTRRALKTTNSIMLQQAKAKAETVRIDAEGQKVAMLIRAEASAEAQRIDAKGRNDAADILADDFARKYALGGTQIDFASALKAKVLTVVPESTIGERIGSQSAFSKSK